MPAVSAQPIELKDAMAQLRAIGSGGKPATADLTFVKFNRQSGKGGQIKHVLGASLVRPKEATAMQGGEGRNPTARKNPRHHLHDTINVHSPADGVVKVHVRLLTKFNGRPVIW